MARKKEKTKKELLAEVTDLHLRLEEAEETLQAIRQGEVDALVVSGPRGDQVYSLQGVEHTYRVLVESMNEGALTLTESGKIIYCNKAFASMANTPCGKMVGVSFKGLISRNDLKRFGILWENALKGTATGEIELNLKGGRVPVYLSCSTRVQDELLTVFVVATDISERKRAEDELRIAHDELEVRVKERTQALEVNRVELEAQNRNLMLAQEELRESDLRYSALFDNKINAIAHCQVITDERGQPIDYLILKINEAHEQIIGVKKANIEGRRVKEVFPGVEKYAFDYIGVLGRIALEGGEIMSETFLDATQQYLLMYAYSPVPREFTVIFTDITDRKRTEEALLKSEERYHNLFNTMDEGFCIIKMIFDEKDKPVDYRFLEVNAAFAKQTGLHEAEGKLMRELAPAHEEHWFEIYGEIALTGEPRHFVNEANALNRWYDVHAYRVGKPEDLQVAIIFNDISAHKRAEKAINTLNDELITKNKELAFSNRELESFIYSVSHDLRGPLRHIYGFTDLLMKNNADKLDVNGMRYLSRICDGSEKMSRLIEDLLNLSRISRQEIHRTEVDMSEIAAALVANLREVHPDRSVDVNIEGHLTSFADSGLIEILLSNLLRNAWKFTTKSERATIEMGAEERDSQVIYYVRDNGVGFDQQYAEKMFWPFHRLHSETDFEGTGIGLAIVDRIVRLHGGRIWAEGIEGKGATIYFSLA